MQKQRGAERDKRAAILTAEGSRQSQITTAEGAKQGAILTAEGERQAQILVAQGQAEAIGTVFEAIHLGRPDPELLAYQYLQTLPKIASGDGNHTWLIPSELTRALDALASGFGDRRTQAAAAPVPSISAPNQVTPTALAPKASANGHTGPTGRRGTKRTAGTQQ